MTDYLTISNQPFGTRLKPGQLSHGDRITHRNEQAAQRFDHYKPAEVLLRNQSTLLSELDHVMVDNFEQLIIRINSTLD